MIPLRDENPTTLVPWVTMALIGANIAAFLYELMLGPDLEPFLYAFGAIPARLFHADLPWGEPAAAALPSVTILTAMFLHGGLLHLGGNMLYLWIFGNNIEDALGHVRFALFYLITGVIAAYSHAFADPDSIVPMIGASGAVSGVLGAYLVLFPRARVVALVPLGFMMQTVRVPAILVLGFWIVIQFVNGFFAPPATGGVAWFAHIGGFAAGAALIHLLVRRDFRRRSRAR